MLKIYPENRGWPIVSKLLLPEITPCACFFIAGVDPEREAGIGFSGCLFRSPFVFRGRRHAPIDVVLEDYFLGKVVIVGAGFQALHRLCDDDGGNEE